VRYGVNGGTLLDRKPARGNEAGMLGMELGAEVAAESKLY
jgi:hypothetical protein